ncbi:unnamed protein product [Pleuronectes platessa]|uniref:Uncharacterized protein n=1 Tax=Pleuronectes platessa TaxID=8262 RepID=A0A9N7U3D3_PLEPL|nr:unnamed protein product [Pleuronectes platessa]
MLDGTSGLITSLMSQEQESPAGDEDSVSVSCVQQLRLNWFGSVSTGLVESISDGSEAQCLSQVIGCFTTAEDESDATESGREGVEVTCRPENVWFQYEFPPDPLNLLTQLLKPPPQRNHRHSAPRAH